MEGLISNPHKLEQQKLKIKNEKIVSNRVFTKKFFFTLELKKLKIS
jgi:hypothetical protein